MRLLPLFAGLLVLNVGYSAPRSEPALNAQVAESASYQVVRDFLQVFNKQDVAAMAGLVAADVRWLSMTKDGTFKADLQGWPALEKWLGSYFSATKNVRSVASNWNANGPYVSFTETANWTSPSGEAKHASSLAVYEVQEGKITRIWYYPAVSTR